MDIITIITQLIPVLLPLIMECLNRDGEEATLASLRACRPLLFFKMRRELIRTGMPRRDAREAALEAYRALRDASDEELFELVEMAKDEEG